MSEENVELVRRIYDAWEQGESARNFIAADIEYVNPSYAVEPGTRQGRKSLAAVKKPPASAKKAAASAPNSRVEKPVVRNSSGRR